MRTMSPAAIRAAHQGEVHLDPAVAGLLARRVRERAATAASTRRAADRPRARGPGAGRQGPEQQGHRRRSSTSPSERPAPTSATSSASWTSRAGPRRRSTPSSTGWSRRADAMAGDGSYEVAGPPDAPAIVLVHGTRLSRAAWRPQIDDLSDEFRSSRSICRDTASLAEVPFTMDGAVNRLAAVIDEAAGGRAVVVGLSLGGYVAIDLAARSRSGWRDSCSPARRRSRSAAGRSRTGPLVSSCGVARRPAAREIRRLVLPDALSARDRRSAAGRWLMAAGRCRGAQRARWASASLPASPPIRVPP